MVALTLFGTAFTAHHADAAEATQDQTKTRMYWMTKQP